MVKWSSTFITYIYIHVCIYMYAYIHTQIHINQNLNQHFWHLEFQQLEHSLNFLKNSKNLPNETLFTNEVPTSTLYTMLLPYHIVHYIIWHPYHINHASYTANILYHRTHIKYDASFTYFYKTCSAFLWRKQNSKSKPWT